MKSRPPLGLRFTAGLGRLLTARVYGQQLAVQAWECDSADLLGGRAQVTRPEALKRWRTRHFRAVPKQQTVRRPPQDGRPASALTEEAVGREERQSLETLAGRHLHWPNVRAKRARTAGRQAWAGENVPRTARPGLVACRWRSA